MAAKKFRPSTRHAERATVRVSAIPRLVKALDSEVMTDLDELFLEATHIVLSVERLEQKLGGARWNRLQSRLSRDMQFALSTYAKLKADPSSSVASIVENLVYAWEDGLHALVRSYLELLNARRIRANYIVELVKHESPSHAGLINTCRETLRQ